MIKQYANLPTQVLILCLGSFINRAGSFVLVFLTIYASERLGLGIAFATACLGVVGFGSILGSLIGGHLADHIGRRPVMLFALFGGAALLLLLGAQTNRWLFMLNIGLFATVADMYRPAASAMIGDLVSPERRPHAFALMYISINLGFAIAPPVGGFLAGYHYGFLFIGDAITTAAYGAVILFSVKETLGAKTIADTDQDSQREAEPHAGKQVSLGAALAHIRRDPTFLGFCVSTFLMGIVFTQGFSTLPLHIRQSGYSNFQLGMLLSINGVMIVMLQLPMTHWLQRFNSMRVLITGGALIAIGFGSTGLGFNAATLAATIVIWTLGEIIQAPFQQSIVTDLAPSAMRARYMGLFSTSFACALMVGAPIGGRILDTFGPIALWTAMFVIAMVGLVVYLSIAGSVTRRITAPYRAGV